MSDKIFSFFLVDLKDVWRRVEYNGPPDNETETEHKIRAQENQLRCTWFIKVIRAHNLVAMDSRGTSDPYIGACTKLYRII